MGGHLAAQAVANLAAALAFSLALKTSFVSYIPTALRLGAGCGVSMLVGVLGMRGIGLLEADSFTVQAPTWKTVSKIYVQGCPLRLLLHAAGPPPGNPRAINVERNRPVCLCRQHNGRFGVADVMRWLDCRDGVSTTFFGVLTRACEGWTRAQTVVVFVLKLQHPERDGML